MLSRRTLLAGTAASAAVLPASNALSSGPTWSTAGVPLAKPLAQNAAILSIGISQFQNSAVLENALNDADLVAKTFSQLGFRSYTLKNPSQDEFLLGLARFRAILSDVEIAAIYVAGHGAYVGGLAHVFPVDTTTKQSKLLNTIPESILVHAIADAPRHKILVMDCCRSELPDETVPKTDINAAFGGLFTLYSAQRGAEAFDGAAGSGPFADSFARHLLSPGLSIEDVALRTRLDVVRETGGAQIPWNSSSLMSQLILHP